MTVGDGGAGGIFRGSPKLGCILREPWTSAQNYVHIYHVDIEIYVYRISENFDLLVMQAKKPLRSSSIEGS